MDLETRNILGYDYLPYMIVVSLEMSDEPHLSPLETPFTSFFAFMVTLSIFCTIHKLLIFNDCIH